MWLDDAVIVSLLDNGGLKTVNKCELMMILMAAVRGLAMFKRVPEVREELMRPLAKRTTKRRSPVCLSSEPSHADLFSLLVRVHQGLFGGGTEVLRQHVVAKAMGDTEIIFFMNDLGAVSAAMVSAYLTYRKRILKQLLQTSATTADGLLAQQGKLTQTMGYVDFQFARVGGGGTCVA